MDLARKAYAAFNRGDVDAALAHLDPEIEWHMSDVFARSPRVFRGHEGVREVWAMFGESLEGFTAEPVRMHEAAGAILAEVRLSGRARGTRERVEFELVQAWTMRDGRATRLEVYATLADARTAKGKPAPVTSSDSTSAAATGRENR